MQTAAQKFVKKIEIKDIKGIQEKFEDVADDNELVDIVNFKRILLTFQSELTSEQADQLIKDILKSQESTDRIDYLDFISELRNLHKYNIDTKMWMVYNQFSDNETGQLPYSELQAALQEINTPKTKSDLKDL